MIRTAFLLIRTHLAAIVRDPRRTSLVAFQEAVDQVTYFMRGASLSVDEWRLMSEQFMDLLDMRVTEAEKIIGHSHESDHAMKVNQLKFDITQLDDRGDSTRSIAEDALELTRARQRRDDLAEILAEAQRNFNAANETVNVLERHCAASESGRAENAKKLESLRRELATRESDFAKACASSKAAKSQLVTIDDGLYALLHRFGNCLPREEGIVSVDMDATETMPVMDPTTIAGPVADGDVQVEETAALIDADQEVDGAKIQEPDA